MDIPGTINIESVLTGATVRALFSEGARTPAQAAARGFLELSEKVRLNVTPQIEQGSPVDVMGTPIPGQLDRIDRRVAQRLMGYEMTSSMWSLAMLAMVYGGDKATTFTQAAIAAAAVDDIAFSPAEPSIAGKWYPLLKAGVQVKHVSDVSCVDAALAALVAGTDFEVDETHGLIRFLTEQDSDITPTLTAAAVTAADPEFMNALTPGKVLIRRGIMRLLAYDQLEENRLVFEHRDFYCTLEATAAGGLSGEGESEITLVASVCYPHGTLYQRRANSPEMYAV